MTHKIIKLALPKLFLWSEAGRFQEYPAALARAEAGRVYSRREVEERLFDIMPTLTYKDGAPRGRRIDGIVNAYGLDKFGNRYRINGINLLRRERGGLIATEEGLTLGREFREDPGGKNWPLVLAKQLILREPRTRLLIGLMLQGYVMEIELSRGVPTGALALREPQGMLLSVTQRDCHTFNELLSAQADLALGPLWGKELGDIGLIGQIQWEGVLAPQPSTHDLPTALKKSLTVFFHIGLFEGDGTHWTLSPSMLQSLLGEVAIESFGLNPTEDGPSTENDAFVLALHEVSKEGFVIVSELANRFGELLNIAESDREEHLDRFVRSALYHGTLRVLEQHQGQPRMGRGLLGDVHSRRVRLEFSLPNDLKRKQDNTDLLGKEHTQKVGGDR